MGSDVHYREEAPAHAVTVDGFWMDRFQVMNAQFGVFVAATGHLTVAERPLDPRDFPDAPPENLVAGSMVFTPTTGPVDLRHLSQWWAWMPGTSWRRPRGPRGPGASPDHPAVHIAYEDADAYAAWAGEECPPRPSGNGRPGAGSKGRPSCGATTRRRPDSTSRTTGTGTSPGGTTTGKGRSPRWARIRRTPMGSTTWPERVGVDGGLVVTAPP